MKGSSIIPFSVHEGDGNVQLELIVREVALHLLPQVGEVVEDTLVQLVGLQLDPEGL